LSHRRRSPPLVYCGAMNGLNEQLLQLTYIRFLTLFGQCAMLIFTLFVLQAEINPVLMSITFAAFALLNLATFARLHSSWPVTEPEFFTHLVADLALFGSLIFQTGGGTNPFIFLLLIPLIIAASTLPWRYTLATAVVAMITYTSLLNHYIELVPTHDSHAHRLTNLIDLHMTGMWLNFILTAIIVTWFISRMRHSLERQQQRLESQREKLLQDQQLISLATMAAGTAHELGTPLSTMRVLLSELQADYQNDKTLQEDLQILQQQVDTCAERLQHMARSVRDEQQSHQQLSASEIVDQALEQWQLMRPDATFNYRVEGKGTVPELESTSALQQALLNLLNNAADAHPNDIRIELDWTDSNVLLRIYDQGPGLSLEQSRHLGKPFVTTKGKGLGIGLFLTSTTLARYNGDVRLYNHETGGTLTEVTLRRSNEQEEDLHYVD